MFVAGNFVPIQVLMIPVRDLSLKLGLYNSVGGLILFHLAFQTGFCALFLRNFIKQLPFELVEAARIEGAGEWTVFVRIILPLIRPALAALSILVFTFVWNDYFWALVPDAGRRRRADHGRRGRPQGAVDHLLEPGLGRLGAGRDALGGDVLPDAEALRGGADLRRDQGLSKGPPRPEPGAFKPPGAAMAGPTAAATAAAPPPGWAGATRSVVRRTACRR